MDVYCISTEVLILRGYESCTRLDVFIQHVCPPKPLTFMCCLTGPLHLSYGTQRERVHVVSFFLNHITIYIFFFCSDMFVPVFHIAA